MKKVILGSLVAMMAVSAANAEIASVEYVGGKTGDIAQLTTTAKSNLTAAVNELNTGVKAAATKTELSEGLATKQATITDLADIRSGATAGATALQQAAIVNDKPSDDVRDKVAPSFDYTSKLIDEASSSIGDLDAALGDLAGTVADNKTAADEGIQDAKDAAANALTDAKAYADGLAGNYDAAGSAATAKSEAIAAAAADATTKADAAEAAAIAAAATDATTKADAAEAAAIAAAAADATTKADAAKDAAIAAAADAAKIYIDASELEASQTAQDTLLKDYADDAADAAEAAAIAAAATDATTKADAAKAAAIAAAADAAKIYIDADELTASQNLQNTELKAYADQVESDANAFTTEQIENLGKLATLPTACAEGTTDCALVIRGGDIKWEKVQY